MFYSKVQSKTNFHQNSPIQLNTLSLQKFGHNYCILWVKPCAHHPFIQIPIHQDHTLIKRQQKPYTNIIYKWNIPTQQDPTFIHRQKKPYTNPINKWNSTPTQLSTSTIKLTHWPKSLRLWSETKLIRTNREHTRTRHAYYWELHPDQWK